MLRFSVCSSHAIRDDPIKGSAAHTEMLRCCEQIPMICLEREHGNSKFFVCQITPKQPFAFPGFPSAFPFQSLSFGSALIETNLASFCPSRNRSPAVTMSDWMAEPLESSPGLIEISSEEIVARSPRRDLERLPGGVENPKAGCTVESE